MHKTGSCWMTLLYLGIVKIKEEKKCGAVNTAQEPHLPHPRDSLRHEEGIRRALLLNKLAGCANVHRSFAISEPQLLHLKNGEGVQLQYLPLAPEILFLEDLYCPGPPYTQYSLVWDYLVADSGFKELTGINLLRCWATDNPSLHTQGESQR